MGGTSPCRCPHDLVNSQCFMSGCADPKMAVAKKLLSLAFPEPERKRETVRPLWKPLGQTASSVLSGHYPPFQVVSGLQDGAREQCQQHLHYQW